MTFHPYERCPSCSGHAQPGTAALMLYLQRQYPYQANWGIYNCRNIGGTSSLSLHSCGKAGDSGVPTLSNGRANTSLGDPMVRFLIKFSSELGMMGIIYNRIRYDRDDPAGAYYGGVHPHYNHIHWEQRMAYAQSLTYSKIIEIAGPPQPQGGDMAALEVIQLQKALNKAGQTDYEGKPLVEDDVYGARTESAWVKGLGSGGTVDAYTKQQADDRFVNINEPVKLVK